MTLRAPTELVVSIPELDFVGHRATSPNGRFHLVWHDGIWGGELGDDRGRYVLIDGDLVLMDGRMDRPHDGKVADDGTFILNDWGRGDQLSGRLVAFRADGEEILVREFAANLLNNGLSADGRLAACQTCHAPNSADSSVLTVFDLKRGAVVAAWTAESGWASSYEFPAGGDRVRLVRRDRPSLDYSLDGEFLDRRLWLRDEVDRGTLAVIRKALAEGEGATNTPLDQLRRGVLKAASDDDPRQKSDALRLLGEIEETAGNMAAALQAMRRR